MAQLITARDDVWWDVVNTFCWHVESRRKFGSIQPDLQERYDSKAWAMVCARQRIAEGYQNVSVYRLHATSIATDEPQDEDAP